MQSRMIMEHRAELCGVEPSGQEQFYDQICFQGSNLVALRETTVAF